LLRLALAGGPGGLSLSQTAAWASVLSLTEMSDPAIKYRLGKAVGFLNALLERQLAGNTTRGPVRWPGRILRVADGTSISKPGSKGTDWRVHGVYDLGRGWVFASGPDRQPRRRGAVSWRAPRLHTRVCAQVMFATVSIEKILARRGASTIRSLPATE
jgi:hypothetical protein